MENSPNSVLNVKVVVVVLNLVGVFSVIVIYSWTFVFSYYLTVSTRLCVSATLLSPLLSGSCYPDVPQSPTHTHSLYCRSLAAGS